MTIDTSLIQKIYIAYFNRPADVAGLKYWLDEVNANRITLGDLAQSFSQQDEFKKNYAGKDNREIVSNLYKNLFGREPDKAGLDYWVSELASNKLQLGGVALAILQGAKPESEDGQIITNKTRYAEAFTLNLAVNGKESSYKDGQNFTDAKTILSGVGKDFYASSGGTGLVTKLMLANGVSGVNSENITQEMTVEAELNLRNAKLGDTLELSLGGSSFPVRLSKTLSLDDLAKKTIQFTIPANQNWGEEGLKTLAVRSLDSSGTPLKDELQLNLNVSLSKPEVPKTEQGVNNLIIETLGGVKQANLLNASNTGFKVTANIPVGIANGQQAYLSLDGKAIAYDYDISATDNKVSFEVNFKSNEELQKAISNGGVLSVSLNTKAGTSLVSTSNPMLKVDYKTSVANAGNDLSAPSDIRVFNPALKTDIRTWTDLISSEVAIQAKITAGQASNGYAELKFNGVVIARDTQIKSGDTTVDFSLYKEDLKLRKILSDYYLKSGQLSVSIYDSQGNTAESQSKLPFTISLINLPDNFFTPFMSGMYKLVYGVVQMKLYPTHTETKQFVKETHVYTDNLPANVAKAELLLNDKVIATDNSVKQGDKVIDFSFTPILGGWIQEDAKIKLYDQAGQVIEATPSLYRSWTSLGSAQQDLSPVAPGNVSFNGVGGIVVPNKLNASNTGFSVKADIPATTEPGVRGELYRLDGGGYTIGNALATLDDIKVGSTSLNFEVSNVKLKSLSSGSFQGMDFKVLLFNAAGEASVAKLAHVDMDFRAPSQPVKGWLLDKANGTKELMVGITSGQMHGGKASLVLDGKEIASDTTITKSDSVVQFNLDSNLAASILNSINEGKVSLNLSDSFANASSVNLSTLKLEKTIAANADLLGPDLAAANPISYVHLPGKSGVGDTFTLRFNEPTQKNISFADILHTTSHYRIESADFGRNASMAWNADGTVLTITVGAYSSLWPSYGGEALILVGLKDLAGNSSELVFTY